MMRSRAILFAIAMALTSVAAAQSPPQRTPEKEEPEFHQVIGGKLALAFMFGGETLKNADTITAGDGIAVSIGATTTPLWFGRLGLGADLDVGFKYESTQHRHVGGFSLSRFPIILSLHAWFRIAGGYFLTLAAGPELDAGITVDRNGGDQPFPDMSNGSALGVMGELGLRYVAGHPAAGVGFRYTIMHYGPPADADASNGAIVFSLLLLW